MTEKTYKLTFQMTDGTEQCATFVIPLPDMDEIVAKVLAELNKPSLISFTFEGTTYQAEEGMTWGEWVNSEYNTGGFVIDENDNSIGTHYDEGTGEYNSWVVSDHTSGEAFVFATDVIIASHSYYEGC